MVRLAWHDSGTYDKDVGIENWPKCGGANGSIRFSPEIEHGANAGLQGALDLLKPIKEQFSEISWADIIQMASAEAVHLAGGPQIPMKYGRLDAEAGFDKEGNLPSAQKPFHDGAKGPEKHLRNIFGRMGFSDKDIVALSGAHTLGRAHKDRSGLGKESTKMTEEGAAPVRADGLPGVGMPGGQSWTSNWLTFDNSYFKIMADRWANSDLLKLETDKCLFVDNSFKQHALVYKDDQDAFFADYSLAHEKLSNLGAKFSPEEGIILDVILETKDQA